VVLSVDYEVRLHHGLPRLEVVVVAPEAAHLHPNLTPDYLFLPPLEKAHKEKVK